MTATVERAAEQLADGGFAVLTDPFESTAQAWQTVLDTLAALPVLDPHLQHMPPLSILAEYTMPTADAPGRPFQVLHFDFGLALGLARHADVARYTALYVDPRVAPSGATTRIVRLSDLAPQRSWPSIAELTERLRNRLDDPDTAEGVLARVIEAADLDTELPAKTDSGFLCGLEFDSVDAESAYLRRHGLVAREQHIVLPPGRVLIFDNLACAHGRVGRRSVGELHQLCVGYRALDRDAQLLVLRHALTELTVEEAQFSRSRCTRGGTG